VSAGTTRVADVRDRLVEALAHVCAAADVRLRALDPDLSGSVEEDGLQAALARQRLRWARDELEDLAWDLLGVDRSVDLPPWRPEPGSAEADEQLRLARLGKRMRAGDQAAAVAWRLGWWRHRAHAYSREPGFPVLPAPVVIGMRPKPRGLHPARRRGTGRGASARARSPGRLDEDPEPPLARRLAQPCGCLVAATGCAECGTGGGR
jgi:hypothetical protein